MLEKAIHLYNVNPQKSLMIGDSNRDIIAAEKVGVKGILIEANTSLLSIIDWIGA